MFTTLVAVIAALVLGHIAPAPVAALRQFRWYRQALGWLGAQGGEGSFWHGRHGLWLALLPPVLLALLLQVLLAAPLLGLPGLLFGVVMLVYAWGPRDLDVDVEAVLGADDAASRRERLDRLAAGPGQRVEEGPAVVGTVFRSALRRWFAPLFWFLLLGPAAALLYRLCERAAVDAAGPLPERNAAGARRLLQWLEWPVAQAMAFSLALAGDFDRVFRAWRTQGGDRWPPHDGFLEGCARAAVSGELAEEADDYRREGYPLVPGELPELRDAMSLVWRMLLLWLALLALLVIAGWVG
ncbi:hypothetical protein B1992_04225 [Pseudoxanthomonas broegbernensis]|uniref:AmpE protein n=1 Tax=Pseudoxanthomonas broegbernensis TaxID=83619 RepID=A0A7V8GNJ1_9GAMM|nr:cobalamin biosynthesis protein [Pseudoxanthomonas broegbernensis]KAF1687198.1 hypothetical protein B1992_04225 [Pseudoxanthomonas broegbernensis]MBB6065817.1 AmpE protein [Pseudoxanthomonas broegbernensis]